MREIWLVFVVASFLSALSLPAAAQPAEPPKPADPAAPAGPATPAPAAPQPAPPPAAASDSNLLAIGPDDRVLGKPDAPITIIEYASLTCPHCRRFETDVLPAVKEKWIDPGKAKLVLRDFPLDEPAMRAAMVARCLPPERFYGFVDTLFRDQEHWAIARDYKSALERLAKFAGMSANQFKDCVGDKTAENRTLAGRLAAAQKLGVDATPTFFINGKKFAGEPTLQSFEQLLNGLAEK